MSGDEDNIPASLLRDIKALEQNGPSIHNERTLSALKTRFNHVRGDTARRRAQQEQHNQERERERGKEQRGAENKTDDLVFLAAITAIDRRIAELERDMAEQYESLKDIYGEDVIGGMAARFLDEETLAGLKTDEERMAALRDHLLNEDGTIKGEYEDLIEAQYIRNWNEHNALAPLADKYRDHKSFTPAERAEIDNAVEQAGFAGKINLLSAESDSALLKIAEAAAAQDIDDALKLKTDGTLTFN